MSEAHAKTQSISRPLQYAYIAAIGGLLLGLAGWS
ncbi:hypothetical protein ACNQPN_29420, partial [Pseudomonas aeruginosa]